MDEISHLLHKEAVNRSSTCIPIHIFSADSCNSSLKVTAGHSGSKIVGPTRSQDSSNQEKQQLFHTVNSSVL